MRKVPPLEMTQANQRGVLLIGHGTREIAGQQEARQLHARVAAALEGTPCELAFLELAQPDIPETINKLLKRGISHLDVVPLLLFAAGHAKSDIPTAVAAALAGAPHVTWRQTPEFGYQPGMLALSRARFQAAMTIDSEAKTVAESSDPSHTLLVMVGRGSGDPSATASMLEYARRHQANVGVADCQVCFVALAQPRMDELLPTLTRSPYRRIVVQPHLLFRGMLLDQLGALVRQCAAQNPAQRWLLTEPLGPDPGLVQVVLDSLQT